MQGQLEMLGSESQRAGIEDTLKDMRRKVGASARFEFARLVIILNRPADFTLNVARTTLSPSSCRPRPMDLMKT